jgi:HEAT repeat protein
VSKKLGASASALALSAAIRVSPPEERANYVFALGFLELTEGLHAALTATQDEDPTVRACAIYALAAVGDPEATAVVVPLLDDDHEVKTWTQAPWHSGARVKDIASAALGRRLGEDRIPSYFPSKLRERIVRSP